ncbi:MAG: DHA2 family efflux MFS transporter permease subunit, partial [Luteimonas sp.]|nr:DHA2 family efflux MFS transporter permease subunit [Luteimonas sp.]
MATTTDQAPGDAPPAGGPAQPFRPPNMALATIGIAMAMFMQVLDITIANVSLPTISGNLGASANQAVWVITSFAVSNAIALPLTGFLTRRFGERRLFVWATFAFAMASLLCGLASSMGMLVAARALQGFVAGPMYPVAQALMISIYPPAKRGQAIALLAMVTVVAPIAGPILGGWITENYSWEWIFFINVPIGIFVSFVVARQLRGRPERLDKPRMDYVGLATLVIGVGALQILLDLGNDEDWFNSTRIVVLAIVAVIALAVFFIWELTDKDPIVDLRLFRHRNFAVGTVALVLAYAAFFAVALIVPLWLQRNLGYTAIWAGLATAPIGVLPVLLTPLVGKYAIRFDLRIVASLAFIVMAATSFARAGFNLDVDFERVAM